MSSMSLLIDRRGSRLSLCNTGVVEVEQEDGPSQRVGLLGLRRIIVHGDAQISARLLRVCRDQGIALVLTTERGKGETLHLFPDRARAVGWRHAQHLTLADPDRRLALARALVRAKLDQQVLWLEAHGLDAATVRRFGAEVDTASGIPALLGAEGAAAARYFALWAGLWQPPWQFPGRNRRPPRDPINALLSLGYTLALSRVGQMAALRGLDPAVGCLHSPVDGRPALALDLLEPVRPWVDQWVWRLLESGAFKPADFTHGKADGCRLSKEARAVFYREWHTQEDQWLPRPARHALAIALRGLRDLSRQGPVAEDPGSVD